MIRVQCSKCGTILQAPMELAGKQAACPKCKAPIAVPIPVAKRSANSEGQEVNPWAGATIQTGPQPAASGSVPPTSPITDQEPQYQPPANVEGADDYRLGIAAAMSFFIPGLGQVFKRQVRHGLRINVIFLALMFGLPILFVVIAAVVNWAIAMASIRIGAVSTGAVLSFAVSVLAFLLSVASFIGAVLYWRWQIFDAAETR